MDPQTSESSSSVVAWGASRSKLKFKFDPHFSVHSDSSGFECSMNLLTWSSSLRKLENFSQKGLSFEMDLSWFFIQQALLQMFQIRHIVIDINAQMGSSYHPYNNACDFSPAGFCQPFLAGRTPSKWTELQVSILKITNTGVKKIHKWTDKRNHLVVQDAFPSYVLKPKTYCTHILSVFRQNAFK